TGVPSPVLGNTATAVSANLTGLTPLTLYHYRVKGINSVGTANGADMTFTTICGIAGAAGPITGPANVCQGSSGYIYTVPPITNATGYLWTLPTGGTITNGVNTNTITVSYSAIAISGNVTVCGTSSCGNGVSSQIAVTVNPYATPTISGTALVCINLTGYFYTSQAGMTGYNWSVSPGGTITAGAGTSTITVVWNTAGAQSVSVNYTNGNGCSAAVPTNYPVTVNTTTIPVITGSNSLCVNSGYYDYTCQSGMTNYQWSISSGGTITFGQGSNTVQVVWNAPGPQTISVTFTSVNGCIPVNPTVFSVNVNPLPGGAGIITGTSTVCAGASAIAYSIQPITNATTYVWTLPMGVTIATGAGTNAITVNFTSNAVTGDITVYGNNLCGNGTVSPAFSVTINPVPGTAGLINGPAEICQGTSGAIYSVNSISNATGYVWTVPTGATIVSGGSTNTITVNFGMNAVSGTITVYGTNLCGSGLPAPGFQVTVSPIPMAPIITSNSDTLLSNMPTGNQWYFGGMPVPGATGQEYIASQSGEYWSVVTQNSCSSDTSNHIWIIKVGVENIPGTASINVFPVPNDGCFTLTVIDQNSETINIRIFNNLGQMVWKRMDIKVLGTMEQRIDLRPAPDGIYSVVFEAGNKYLIRKILIAR
ncbi:MAG: T9SS type A sorting domain-containing protein, partial [Bacteroidota bacterium]